MKDAGPDKSIAWFISPHGFGHAARAAAIMAELQQRALSLRCEIFTRVPRWFFEQSLLNEFGYHSYQTDIGLVQQSPLVADLRASYERLNSYLPFDEREVASLAKRVRGLRCSLIVCDISPLGLEVARRAGIPSVLVENFTWDWIYEGYLASEPRLEKFIPYLRAVFESADYHVQTEPVCHPVRAHLLTRPVSRKARMPAQQVRRELKVPAGSKAVLVTMGGVPALHEFLDQLKSFAGTHFVIAGVAEEQQQAGNVTFIARDSHLFHPDLVRACDAIAGKTGYSTVAEVYQAGVPFGFVAREDFRESQVLASFIQREMRGLAFTEADFAEGRWLNNLPELLALPRIERGPQANGAAAAASFLLDIMKRLEA